MPLYPEFPQGVLSPGYMDIAAPQPAARQRPPMNMGATAPQPMGSSQIAAAMGPQAVPETKRSGFLGRIREQPGGSRALLAMGASLLSNQNFFEGLGQGAMAYQGVLDQEREARLPQLTDNQQFSYTRDPVTGEMTWDRTAVGDFEFDQEKTKLDSLLARVRLQENGDTARQTSRQEHESRWNQVEDERLRSELEYQDRWKEQENTIAQQRIESAERIAAANEAGQSATRGSAGAQRQIGDYTTIRDGLDNSLTQLDPVIQQIESGELTFGIASNLYHRGALASGIGVTDETVAFSMFETTLESLRNALLLANKGVQTDGDADRAMAELLSGRGSSQSILANMRRVRESVARRSSQAQARIDDISGEFGSNVSSSSPQSRSAPTANRAAPSVSNW